MVGLVDFVPEAVHSTHYHYHKERKTIYIALEGSATLRLNEVDHPFKPNMVVFIPPGDRHCVIHAGKEGFKFLEIVTPLVSNDLFEMDLNTQQFRKTKRDIYAKLNSSAKKK
jgi:mannose-6-phosphate isomerase-like protein (cupin superfamily)